MQSNPIPFLTVIVGPTAVGKTELALEVAKRIGGEIVSADSRLFYRGMDIGTAKPTKEERQRVTHHLIDVANPDDMWSLAIFQKEAHCVIEEIWKRGKFLLLVGGTGQFIRAVVEEWSIPAQSPDTRLRQVLERWGQEIGPIEMHRKVSLIDPEAAQYIEPRNLRRSVRALEVILKTGRLFSNQRTKSSSRYKICQVGLIRPRHDLYRRVDDRIDSMISGGLLGEVENLLAQGYSKELPVFSAIGYHEMIEIIDGQIDLNEAIRLMKRNTRQFIRRQANWFKSDDPSINWFEMNENTAGEVSNFLLQEIEDYKTLSSTNK